MKDIDEKRDSRKEIIACLNSVPYTGLIEYLLFLSTQGLHILFGHEALRKICESPIEDGQFFNTSNMKRIQKLLTKFSAQPGLKSKEIYLKNLNPHDLDTLARTYFYLLETTIHQNSTRFH